MRWIKILTSALLFQLMVSGRVESAAAVRSISNRMGNDTFLYFAYGSNLLSKRIHIQNPTAERRGIGRLKVSSAISTKVQVINNFEFMAKDSYHCVYPDIVTRVKVSVAPMKVHRHLRMSRSVPLYYFCNRGCGQVQG